MGNPKGFIEVERKVSGNRPVRERVDDYGEVEQVLDDQDRRLQASRCMDCGIPYCHWACPVGSKIPEWQDALYKGDYGLASQILHSTNSFPEFTGRVCPAPCEKSCVLAIHDEAVTIRENEASTVEKAFELGLVIPRMPKIRTGKKVAVIGSGPSGLSVADRLNQAGHSVCVFERDDALGGLLRYGIPDFKLNKKVVDRRIQLFEAEGIEFRTNVSVGETISGKELLQQYDAVVLAIGAMKPRDLAVEGRELAGVYFAMEYLKQQNKVNRGVTFNGERINAAGKRVLVIGGGDTGSDCVGTANRQRAEWVGQLEILPRPPEKRQPGNPWPYWANVLKISSSHEEGCERMWSLSTHRFIGEKGRLTGVEVQEVDWKKLDGKWQMQEKEGTLRIIKADMVLLSMGFVHPVHEGLITELGLELDQRGNIKVDKDFATSQAGVFASGDAAIGASLVVTAIAKGQECALKVHEFLKKLTII
jgi:glutamate synthase (NADPH/NADH) small chain